MKVDSNGIEFLIKEEGFVPYVYKDSRGLDTFGVGTLIDSESEKYLYKYTKQNQAPKQVVYDLFNSEVKKYEIGVNKELESRNIKINQNQFNALVSFAYNVGLGGFQKSYLLRDLKNDLKNKNFDNIKKNFLNWSSKGLLTNRRNSEIKLFFKEQKKNNIIIPILIIGSLSLLMLNIK